MKIMVDAWTIIIKCMLRMYVTIIALSLFRHYSKLLIPKLSFLMFSIFTQNFILQRFNWSKKYKKGLHNIWLSSASQYCDLSLSFYGLLGIHMEHVSSFNLVWCIFTIACCRTSLFIRICWLINLRLAIEEILVIVV